MLRAAINYVIPVVGLGVHRSINERSKANTKNLETTRRDPGDSADGSVTAADGITLRLTLGNWEVISSVIRIAAKLPGFEIMAIVTVSAIYLFRRRGR